MSHPSAPDKLVANPSIWRVAALAAALLSIGASARSSTAQPSVNARAAVLKGFSDRVQQYIDLSNKVDGQLSKLAPTNDAAKIDAHRKALAGAWAASAVAGSRVA